MSSAELVIDRRLQIDIILLLVLWSTERTTEQTSMHAGAFVHKRPNLVRAVLSVPVLASLSLFVMFSVRCNFQPLKPKERVINKSRYDSIDTYISLEPMFKVCTHFLLFCCRSSLGRSAHVFTALLGTMYEHSILIRAFLLVQFQARVISISTRCACQAVLFFVSHANQRLGFC